MTKTSACGSLPELGSIPSPEREPRRRRRRGFSLIELMISVGIMSTTLLLVLGVFTGVMRASRKSVDLTAGTLVAESVMNRELYSIMSGNASDASTFFSSGGSRSDADRNDTLGAGEVLTGTEQLNETTFTYKMVATPLTFSGSSTGKDTSVTAKNHLVKVDVVVWWWNAGSKSGQSMDVKDTNEREGYGVLRTELSRLVNQNSKF